MMERTKTEDTEWICLLGGPKQAVMFYADFVCFLIWENLKFNLLSENRMFFDKKPSSPRQQVSGDDILCFVRLFPDCEALRRDHTHATIIHLWDRAVSNFEDPLQLYFKTSCDLSTVISSSLVGRFQASLRSFLSTRSLVNGHTIDVASVINTGIKSLRGTMPRCADEEIRYYSALAIRKRCGSYLAPETARNLQEISDALNAFITARLLEDRANKVRQGARVQSSTTMSATELLRTIGGLLRNPFLEPPNPENSTASSGVGLCYLPLLGDLRVLTRRSTAVVGTKAGYRYLGQTFDTEYALSMLFGFPLPGTQIDLLFGGGGMFLYDAPHLDGSLPTGMPGRITLVRGGFGSGKTSLGLTAAVAVAKAGGLAVYFALEFDRIQTLFILERLGFDTKGQDFVLFESLKHCIRHFRHIAKTRCPTEESCYPDVALGGLLVLPVSSSQIGALDSADVFELLAAIADSDLHAFPRMVVVDSLNAVKRALLKNNISGAEAVENEGNGSLPKGAKDDHAAQGPELRRNVFRELGKATSKGTNVFLLSEEDDDSWSSFGEDIADTVIRLFGSLENSNSGLSENPPFRSINISKSRYQKEHAGSHPFSIIPGKGIRVFLSTEARASIDHARAEVHLKDGRFGAQAIDALLAGASGELDSSDCGKVVYLEGQLGTFKTQFGICFLQASWLEQSNEKVEPCGLFISMRYDDVDIAKKESDKFCRAALERRRSKNGNALLPSKIRTCKLPSGDVFPDEIFQIISAHIDVAELEATPIRRVLLDNPGEWEDLCPRLMGDPLFAGTLMSFLRRRGVRILVTNRFIAATNSRLIRAILEQVETSIVLGRRDVGEDSINTIQIVRSPGMNHLPKIHEIIPKERLQFTPVESSQFSSDGRIVPLKVRLICRRQTSLSEKYWQNVKALFQAIRPSEVSFDETGSFGHRFPFDLSRDAVLDFLGIVEIDEFELDFAQPALLSIDSERFQGIPWKERLKARTTGSAAVVKAIPFFDNTSCLMFDAKALAKFDIPIYDAGLTWEAIASVASQWNEDRAFFSIPADESENWNCLFLEVFYSLFDKDAFLTKKVTFEKLLCSEVNAEGYKLRDEVFTASLIFNKLLYGHSKKLARWRTTAAVNKYDVAIPNAVVSRQWFTTLQQTVSQFTSQSFGVYRGAGNAAEASKNGAQENAPESIENYLIRRLPGGFTCSGEWYLGILRKSVATNFGERFLEFIGSVESDRDRVRLGVGLSVLEQKRTPLTDRATSICVGVDSFEALPNDCSFIERSRISEYRSWTAIMAQTLRSIAKIDPSSKPESHVEFAWKTFLGTINSDSCK